MTEKRRGRAVVRADRPCLECGELMIAPRSDRLRHPACVRKYHSRLQQIRRANGLVPKRASRAKPPEQRAQRARRAPGPKAERPAKPPPWRKPKILAVGRDAPPWFPGWNGSYAPDLTDLQVELLEGEKGRPMPDQAFATQRSRDARGFTIPFTPEKGDEAA